MIKNCINNLILGKDLTRSGMEQVMNEIMEGEATPAQIACFLTALRLKGETVPEITGGAAIMRQKVTKVISSYPFLVDTCGTGGDGAHTFNISTVSAFVAAGAGVIIAKHGNRSVSSKCGSADVLEELGVNIEAPVDVVGRCIDKVGIGFMYAPLLHKAMKHAIGPRREIGIRTIFNILGPLTNPAGAQGQVLGVFSKELTNVMANVLKNLGTKEAWVVHGADGLDEITTTGKTFVSRLKNENVEDIEIDPGDYGITICKKEDLVGGDKKENAQIVKDILGGLRGPKRDIVVLNAAASICCGQLAGDLAEGIKKANEAIDSGKAKEKLESLIRVSKES